MHTKNKINPYIRIALASLSTIILQYNCLISKASTYTEPSTIVSRQIDQSQFSSTYLPLIVNEQNNPNNKWNENYQNQKNITIEARGEAVPAGHPISINLDLEQMIQERTIRPDYNDLRIVYKDDEGFHELERYVLDPEKEGQPSEIWFRTPNAIEDDGFDSSLYLCYGNLDEETNPPSDPKNIFTLFDDFNYYDDTIWPIEQPESVTVQDGKLIVTAYNPDGTYADTCPCSEYCMKTQMGFTSGHMIIARAEYPDHVTGENKSGSVGFSVEGHGNEIKTRSYNVWDIQALTRKNGINTIIRTLIEPDEGWNNYRITWQDDYAEFTINGSEPIVSTTNIPDAVDPSTDQPHMGVVVRSYSAIQGKQSRTIVDYIIVTPKLENEPAIYLKK